MITKQDLARYRIAIGTYNEDHGNDAAFIAASRDMGPRLLVEVERLQAIIDGLRK